MIASASKGLFKREASDQGEVVTRLSGTYEIPHPPRMPMYEGWCKDPDTDTALDLLADMVAGVGSYTQMPQEDEEGKKVEPNHSNLQKCRKWLKKSNFRTKYREIQRVKMAKGFCPIEPLPNGSLKILPPETFYIWREPTGRIIKYIQKINESPVAEWDPNDIVIFARNQDTSHPYGISIVDSIGDLIDARKQLNEDVAKIIHRFAAPRGIHECDTDIEPFKKAMMEAEVDEDVYVGNVTKDSLRHEFLEPDPRIKFEGYINRIDIQIDQRLHAPLILLLKSATEASATKMLESVDRHVQSEQEQNAEIIEQFFFKPLCGNGPIPEFLHKLPNTKMEKITFGEIGILQANRTITWEQAQDLIRQKGVALKEDKQPAEPPQQPNYGSPWNPNQPSQPPKISKKPDLEFLVEHLNDIDTALNVILESYQHGKLQLSEACRMGGETITVRMKRAYPETWEAEREKKFSAFTRTLLNAKATTNE